MSEEGEQGTHIKRGTVRPKKGKVDNLKREGWGGEVRGRGGESGGLEVLWWVCLCEWWVVWWVVGVLFWMWGVCGGF